MLVLPIALPTAQAAHAESFFSKGIMDLAKVVGKFTTPKISTLDDVILTGGIGVESIEKAKGVSGPLGEVKYTASRSDGKFIKVTAEPNLNMGLAHKGTDKDLNMEYDFFKPNAFLGHPFTQLKNLGLKSFAIRDTTYKKSVSTSTTTITKMLPVEAVVKAPSRKALRRYPGRYAIRNRPYPVVPFRGQGAIDLEDPYENRDGDGGRRDWKSFRKAT